MSLGSISFAWFVQVDGIGAHENAGLRCRRMTHRYPMATQPGVPYADTRRMRRMFVPTLFVLALTTRGGLFDDGLLEELAELLEDYAPPWVA